jgi:hypothetical protein
VLHRVMAAVLILLAILAAASAIRG